MKKIELKKIAGEFCTERTNAGLIPLKNMIVHSLSHKELLFIDRSDVKILTTSFIDELLSELALKHSLEVIQNQIQFTPPLEDFYWEQVKRGKRLRKTS